MKNVNQLIDLKPIQIGSILLNKKFDWNYFQFRKDTKTAMLNGVIRFYDENGIEINQDPIVPKEFHTQTETGRDFINSQNGAYCSRSQVNGIDTFTEVISGNQIDASFIISQFDYLASLLGSGVDILILLPQIVTDLDNRNML